MLHSLCLILSSNSWHLLLSFFLVLILVKHLNPVNIMPWDKNFFYKNFFHHKFLHNLFFSDFVLSIYPEILLKTEAVLCLLTSYQSCHTCTFHPLVQTSVLFKCQDFKKITFCRYLLQSIILSVLTLSLSNQERSLHTVHSPVISTIPSLPLHISPSTQGQIS